MNEKEIKDAINKAWPYTTQLSDAEFAMARDLWAARTLLSECLQMAEHWPGIAYSNDLEKRVTEFLKKQMADDYLTKLWND